MSSLTKIFICFTFEGIENNDLSGSLISEIGSLKSLTRIVLGGNQLTGTIPIELGALSNLGKS